VASWASLFQSKEDSVQLERSGIGHYSCTNLLMEMEMAGSESEDLEGMPAEDFELVRIPEKWQKMLEEEELRQELPEDIYTIPNQNGSVGLRFSKEVADLKESKAGDQSKKWGPVLVGKRPSRRPHDGRSIL
jgi:hypothetical protein